MEILEKLEINNVMPQVLKSNRIINIKDHEEFTAALKDYLIISNQENIDNLCNPLKSLDIFYLLYVKRFKDGSQIEITNHPKWSEYYYTHHYYKLGPFVNPKQLYENSTYLWSSAGTNVSNIVIRDLFNIDHGISMVYKYSDCNEFFHFATCADNNQITNFYLNNTDLLRRFIIYFKDKASSLIKTCENFRIMLPIPEIKKAIDIEGNSRKILHRKFIADTPIHRFHVSNESPNTYLTEREMECLHWHAKGKSAIEIAIILGISSRTVEVHLENVKRKLNCHKQIQLGYKFGTFEMPL